MPAEVQVAKDLVLRYHDTLDRAGAGREADEVLRNHLAADHAYRGMHPFGDQAGAAAVAELVWSPLKRAMPQLQRRQDLFFASRDHLRPEGDLWVASMGHFIGDFTEAWLGIPPTGRATYLPYAALYRVADGKIAETVEFLDILAVLTQAGRNPHAGLQTGGQMMSPGPRTHDGLLTHTADPEAGARTHELTIGMLTELAESYTSPEDHLARHWHSDMNWFGPAGIGASIGFPGYRRGHTGPFEEKLDMVDIVDWEIAVAEGSFSAVMWWPCLRMRNSGGYMGVPANEALTEMRVIDLYRRAGGKLAENWIFIDMLHFLKLQGVDLLEPIGG